MRFCRSFGATWKGTGGEKRPRNIFTPTSSPRLFYFRKQDVASAAARITREIIKNSISTSRVRQNPRSATVIRQPNRSAVFQLSKWKIPRIDRHRAAAGFSHRNAYRLIMRSTCARSSTFFPLNDFTTTQWLVR